MIHHINKMRDKNYTIISIDAEKVFDKIITSVYDKNSQQNVYGGNVPQQTKAIYDKPRDNIIFNDEKAESFSSKIRNKTRMDVHSTNFIQHSVESPSHSS